ncbi:MAG: tetratricopeptide repeat protein [Thermoflexales bacterium]|nr:tetratricopeptide repeat protein [Thermoflexales bacterium]
MEFTLSRDRDRINVDVDGVRSHAFDPAAVTLTDDDPLEVEQNPRPYGKRLFEALFPTESAARNALAALTARDSLRLVLLDDALQRLPWEYLRDPSDRTADEGFLALKYVIMRALPATLRTTMPAASGSARVLVVASDPAVDAHDVPIPALDIERGRRELIKVFERTAAALDVHFLQPATLDSLHGALAETAAGGTAIHFLGHGIARPSGAALFFEDRAGNAHEVAARDLVAPAGGRARLVFLNACESATTLESPMSNAAYQLALAGVPYAVGMQFKVPEVVALRLSAVFYQFLAQGHSVEHALHEARRAVWADGSLREVPRWNGGTVDYRAFALGIAVGHTGLAEPQAVWSRTSDGGQAAIREAKPAMRFDAVIAEAQTFRGRAVELGQLGRLLEHGQRTEDEVGAALRREGRQPAGAKVIVIRGIGGMGKSALARRAATRFAWRFPAGILGISLEQLPSSAALVQQIGTWRFGDAFEQVPPAERERRVIDTVRGSQMLLVLDNYETVLDAARDPGRKDAAHALPLLVRQLAGGEGVLLLTSREQVTGLAASELPVDGLGIPEGRELFWDFARERRREADEEAAAQLVDKVGGHPLALELLGAAYAGRHDLDLKSFIRGLDDMLGQAAGLYGGPRQATMGACFDYSFRLLSAEAQALFPKLGLFEAPVQAEQVAEIFDAPAAAETLSELRRKSLIRVVEDWGAYYLHPMARWYAGRRVTHADLAQAHGLAFARAYARLARTAAISLQGKTDTEALQLAQLQMTDLLGARRYLEGAALGEHDYGCATLLSLFGDLVTAWALLEEARQLAEASDDRHGLGLVQYAMARVLETRGDLDRAMALYQQSLDLYEKVGNLQGKADTLHNMAGVFETRGDLDRAMDLYRQSLDLKEKVGDLQGKAATLHQMAGVFETRGDLDRAMALYQQSLDIKEKVGDLKGKAATLHNMAVVLATRGDLDRAMGLYQQSLDIEGNLGDLQGKAATLHQMAGVLETRGDLDRAMALYQQSLDNEESLGDLKGKAATLHNMAGVLVTRGDLDGAMELYQQSLDIKEKVGNLQGKAATLHQMAGVLATRGDLDRAMALYQQSLDLKDKVGDLKGKAVSLANIGTLLFKINRPDAAVRSWLVAREIFAKIGANPAAKTISQLLGQAKEILGDNSFLASWQRATGNAPLPDWLK